MLPCRCSPSLRAMRPHSYIVILVLVLALVAVAVAGWVVEAVRWTATGSRYGRSRTASAF